jgi:nitrite reductase/ring-hydroxylating ferredoxin subunit
MFRTSLLKRKWLWLVAAVVSLSLVIGLAGCAGTSVAADPISPKWVQAFPDGDSITLPLADVENYGNVHFKVTSGGDTAAFMAYQGTDGIVVRANVCPPCRSQGFSLAGDVLVCDTCATTFEADTGDGIQGACVDFPKAEVAYTTVGGNVVMTKADLFQAYQNTNNPGRP